MADYLEALKQGLEAADAAARARAEIDAVFTHLDQEIRRGTDEKISIDRRELEVIQSGWLALAVTFPPRPKETYWAIAAHNPSVAESLVKQLAKWSQHRRGYPCKITWGSTEYTCEDREALEGSLAALLRDPLVAEKLRGLMQLEGHAPDNTAQQDAPADSESP